MPHGKPITISRAEYTEPSPIPRRDVAPGQVFSHKASNVDDGDLYVALLTDNNSYVANISLNASNLSLSMQISTGLVLSTGRGSLVYLRDADLTVGGAK